MSRSATDPLRAEVWTIRFDPIQGAEIDKLRPAVVVNPVSVGRLPLRIVVPVTGWSSSYSAIPWLVPLQASTKNGLRKKSAADCFQVRSVSLRRFITKIGHVRADEIQEISAAVALCVGA